jgi:hypothetical protein
LRGILESNASIHGIDDYRFIVGQIFALKRVVDSYFDEVNEDLNKEK